MKFLVVFFLFTLGAALAQEVVIDAQPFLKFKNPPFALNGVTMVPAREVANALNVSVEKVLALGDTKNFIRLHDKIHGGEITFAPAREIAHGLQLDIIKTDALLTIGLITWEVTGKLIVIDRGRQKVHAFEGLKQVYECRTCTGRPGYTTPTGIFSVYKKIHGKHNVVGKPWGGIMYNPLYYDGCAALHGSSEMREHPSSHGCCRLFYRDADWLYKWTPISTTVYIIP